MTKEQIRAMFEYQPDGRLRRILGGRVEYPGRGIGYKQRYIAWDYERKTYYLHQLVWLYHHGIIPAQLDHINGNTRDNRIENLRECSNAQNQYNVARKTHNKSGFKGVHLHRYSKLWHAKITVNRKVISLGYHHTAEEAGAAYITAAAKYAEAFAHPNPNGEAQHG